MRAWKGGACEVGIQDAKASVGAVVIASDEPSESGAKEGGRGRDEGFSEGVVGGEGSLDFLDEVVGRALGSGREGAEHEMVVVCH